MYWYESKFSCIYAALICGIALTVFWIGCKPEIKTGPGLKYFDLKEYLSNDVVRLKKINKKVIKTVCHNGVTETKVVHIDNWSQELGLFLDADINKPAWKSSYTTVHEDSLLVYRAKEPGLTVRELIIKKDKQKVKWMLIYTKTENALYKTTQKLTYFPDSLYSVEMEQKVKLLGKNIYKVQGEMVR